MKYVNIYFYLLLKVQKHCLDTLLFLNWESIYLYLWFGDDLDGDHIRETLRKKIYSNSYSGTQWVVPGKCLSEKMIL